jgi:organic hydroperoxide reductase OsmC/OhrA
MSAVKAHRFPVAVRQHDQGTVRVRAPGKPELRAAPASRFNGSPEGVWSPEELFAASVASCFAVTLDAVAEQMRVPLRDVDIRTFTNVARIDGRSSVTQIDVTAIIETDPGHVEGAREAAARAQRRCLIVNALDCPVRIRVDAGALTPTPLARAGLPAARSGRALRGSRG